MSRKQRKRALRLKRKEQRENYLRNYANKSVPIVQNIIQSPEKEQPVVLPEVPEPTSEPTKVEVATKKEITMEIKSFLKSKTFWVGIIEIVIGVLLALKDQLLTGGVLSGVGIIQLILRAITSQPIGLSSK